MHGSQRWMKSCQGELWRAINVAVWRNLLDNLYDPDEMDEMNTTRARIAVLIVHIFRQIIPRPSTRSHLYLDNHIASSSAVEASVEVLCRGLAVFPGLRSRATPKPLPVFSVEFIILPPPASISLPLLVTARQTVEPSQAKDSCSLAKLPPFLQSCTVVVPQPLEQHVLVP